MRYRADRTAKKGKQDMDDSIKLFNVQPLHTFSLYTYYVKRCKVELLYTELFYAIIPTLFPAFYHLLSLQHMTLLLQCPTLHHEDNKGS